MSGAPSLTHPAPEDPPPTCAHDQHVGAAAVAGAWRDARGHHLGPSLQLQGLGAAGKLGAAGSGGRRHPRCAHPAGQALLPQWCLCRTGEALRLPPGRPARLPPTPGTQRPSRRLSLGLSPSPAPSPACWPGRTPSPSRSSPARAVELRPGLWGAPAPAPPGLTPLHAWPHLELVQTVQAREVLQVPAADAEAGAVPGAADPAAGQHPWRGQGWATSRGPAPRAPRAWPHGPGAPASRWAAPPLQAPTPHLSPGARHSADTCGPGRGTPRCPSAAAPSPSPAPPPASWGQGGCPQRPGSSPQPQTSSSHRGWMWSWSWAPSRPCPHPRLPGPPRPSTHWPFSRSLTWQTAASTQSWVPG